MPFTFKPVGGLEGLVLVEGRSFPDERGFFMESWREDDWRAAGFPPLVQDNLSRSRKNVVRGLHYQKPPQAIGKLVRCLRGRIFDVAVDLRRGSPSFGRWAGVELTDEGSRMLWIPEGFAHGFCALSDVADVAYKVTGYWSPAVDGGLLWSDPDVGVRWPVEARDAVVSAKDAALPRLAQSDAGFVWRG